MKLLFFKGSKEKHYLSAEETRNILRYGFKNVTLNEAVSINIKNIESAIETKSGLGYRVTIKIFQEHNRDLVERLKDHFKEQGFLVDIYNNPEISNSIALIIGW